MAGSPYQMSTERPAHTANVSQGVRIIPFIVTHTLTPCILGSLLVVGVLPFVVLILVVWMLVLVVSYRRHVRADQSVYAAALIGIQVFVMLTIIIAAHVAPVKTTDRVLSRSVTLPKTEMTLADLQKDADIYSSGVFPIKVWMTVPDADRSVLIRFSARQLTLHDFVAAVENQSSLRHQFRHCGNGATVLWGGDCSFGLHLRDPKNPYGDATNAR